MNCREIVCKTERCAISVTGTGFAYAKLSEARSSPRVARVVRVTQKREAVRILPAARVNHFARMTKYARVLAAVGMTDDVRVARFGRDDKTR